MGIAATTAFEVRTTGSDTQCSGGFNSARGGTDYTLQDTAQATGTVTVSGTTCTATTGIFTSAMVGNTITDGTSIREITAFTSSTVVTLDSTVAWTATTIYVGGALLSPGKAGAYHVSGNTIYVKAGTYTVTSASSNVAGGCLSLTAGVATAITRVIGYQATRLDDGTKPVLQANGITAFTLVSLLGNSMMARNLTADGNNLTSSKGFNCSTGCFVVLCKGINCKSSAFSGGGPVWLCEATGCSTTAVFTGGQYFYCTAHDNTVTGFSPSTAVGCLAANNTGASSDGFGPTFGEVMMTGCTSYANGRHGFNFVTQADTRNYVFSNCLSVNNGGNGFGAQGGAMDNAWLYNCAGYNNTSGNVSSNITAGNNYNFITLSGDPFTTAAGNNFSLNNTAGAGAACRAAGIPGAASSTQLPGLSTNSYPDVGASQHQDSGGTTGGFVFGS